MDGRRARARRGGGGAPTGRALSWPPSRNDPCWCESGRKYKRCCGGL
ncbi:MAG: SEC-C domain-containing protein [Thermoleophilaceae bacterium]|nr:SEC-C domain-containing protein [Thermoleophilaceae bacterium]